MAAKKSNTTQQELLTNARSQVRGDSRLSDPGMAQGMQTVKDRLRTEPDFSKRLLTKAGILTARGNIAKSFGG